jgi:hypothetical protein
MSGVKFKSRIDLNYKELENARIQEFSSMPALTDVVLGQIFKQSNHFYIVNKNSDNNKEIQRYINEAEITQMIADARLSVYRIVGSFDPANGYPTAERAGDVYTASAAGSIGDVYFTVGDQIVALVDEASVEGDYNTTNAVQKIDGDEDNIISIDANGESQDSGFSIGGSNDVLDTANSSKIVTETQLANVLNSMEVPLNFLASDFVNRVLVLNHDFGHNAKVLEVRDSNGNTVEIDSKVGNGTVTLTVGQTKDANGDLVDDTFDGMVLLKRFY